MPTEPGGALGSLDHTKEERRALAIKSHEAAPRYGTPERQMLIDEIHQYMLSKAPPILQLPAQTEGQSINRDRDSAVSNINNQPDGTPVEGVELAAENDRIVEDVREVNWNANAGPIRFRFNARLRRTRCVPVNPDEQLQGPDSRRSSVFVD